MFCDLIISLIRYKIKLLLTYFYLSHFKFPIIKNGYMPTFKYTGIYLFYYVKLEIINCRSTAYRTNKPSRYKAPPPKYTRRSSRFSLSS